MEIKIALCFLLFASLVNAFPKKLLRVPKIYNALITTNEKLLPSEAYPATTGPVFQPIGLTGEPILLNPEAFQKNGNSNLPQENGANFNDEGGDYEVPESRQQPRPFAPSQNSKEAEKMPTPITFYPRYSVYHPYQPFLPYSYPVQQPFLYSYGTNFNPVVPGIPDQDERVQSSNPQPSPAIQNTGTQERSPPVAPLSVPSAESGYVKNNQPQNPAIPDVPPPPPPVGVPRPDAHTSEAVVMEMAVEPSDEDVS